jgi:hypothetical protein
VACRSTAQAQTVPFTPVQCPIAPIEGLTTDCGYLTVPESRSNYTGKTIQLAVAICARPIRIAHQIRWSFLLEDQAKERYLLLPLWLLDMRRRSPSAILF